MNHAAKYVPKIKFLGARLHTPAHSATPYVHRVVNYQRIPISTEEIEAIN